MSDSTARLWLVTNDDRCGLAGVVGLLVWLASGSMVVGLRCGPCGWPQPKVCNTETLIWMNAFQVLGPDMLIR
jgi:hypothetical protein